MIGKLTIEADGKHIHTSGNMSFRGKTEIYKLICCIAEMFDVNSAEEWANLVCYSALTLGENMPQYASREKIEIKIPNINKKEKDHD